LLSVLLPFPALPQHSFNTLTSNVPNTTALEQKLQQPPLPVAQPAFQATPSNQLPLTKTNFDAADVLVQHTQYPPDAKRNDNTFISALSSMQALQLQYTMIQCTV
jgi:hypothetical protein